MKAINVDHVVLEVADVDRAIAFYVDVLGLEPVRVQEFRTGAAPFPSVRAGATLIDLFKSDKPGPGPNHLCIEVDVTAEVMAQTLRARGLDAGEPGLRYGAQGMGSSVYISDPDGHKVEVRTYREPSPNPRG